jgi:hypothetical protein
MMNLITPNRRQASSTVAFLAYGEVVRSGVFGSTRFPARNCSG